MTTADPSPPAIRTPYFNSKFSRWVTLVLGVLLALFFTFASVPRTPEQRVRDLEHPVRSAVRQFERDLEIHDALATVPGWMRALGESVFESSSETRAAAVLGYRDVLAMSAAPKDAGESGEPNAGESSALSRLFSGDHDASSTEDKASTRIGPEPVVTDPAERAQLVELRARLAILLEEFGREDEARMELARLDDDGQPGIVEAIRAAYGDGQLAAARGSDSFDLSLLEPGWAKDRLQAKLAARTSDTALASRLEAEAARRDDHWQRRALFLTFLFLTPCLIGLLLFLAWCWKDRPPVLAASAPIPPTWGWDDGCSVLVRAAFAGMVVSSAVALYSQTVAVNVFSLWIELVASLPMLWWIRRALLKPSGIGFGTAFGLWPTKHGASIQGTGASSTELVHTASARTTDAARASLGLEPTLVRKILGWTAFTLALIALDQLGAGVIAVVCRQFGAEPHWSETVQESMMWSTRSAALFGAVDGTVWAPIFEEIGCRGLLYLTLRTRAGPQTAALFSASLFATVHVYSMPGFLSVAWSGYVWAIAFERCRSLLPGMICHAFWNGFLMASNYLFYR